MVILTWSTRVCSSVNASRYACKEGLTHERHGVNDVIDQMLELSIWQMQIDEECDQLMQYNVTLRNYIQSLPAERKTPPFHWSYYVYEYDYTAVQCTSQKESIFTHLHDWKGLYKPLVSKLSMPGYVIGGVGSPRQFWSLRYCQQCISAFPSLAIARDLLIQCAGAIVALVRTGRLHLAAQIRGNDIYRCLSMSEVFVYTRKGILTA